MGIETPETCKHLGLYLSKNIENTIENTMRNTEPKRIKRRILGTTPPADLLQSTSYQHYSYSYLHSHIYGPTSPKKTNERTASRSARLHIDQTRRWRRLVAKDRISAIFNRGGLQVPHPSDTAEGLHLNLLQKIQNKIWLPHRFPPSHLPPILEETLQAARCPTYMQHLKKYGPDRWDKTAEKIKNRNLLFSQAFQTVAKLLSIHEKDRKTCQTLQI
jgi:hypothetical protein